MPQTTTLATCWRITLADSTTIGFTTLDTPIALQGQHYHALPSGTLDELHIQQGLSLDHSAIKATLAHPILTAKDLAAGRYDHAEITLFRINYLQPDSKPTTLFEGLIGEVIFQQDSYHAELIGWEHRLQQPITQRYSNRCRATLGDTQCGVTLTPYHGIVSHSHDLHSFDDQTLELNPSHYHAGLVTFTSGSNKGRALEIVTIQPPRITLALALPYPLRPGDQYQMVPGCDKRLNTCSTRFGNAINFRGEPHLPGITYA